MAALTLSLASSTDLSGRPTMAEAVGAVLNLVEAASHVHVALLKRVDDSGVAAVTLHGVGHSVLVGLGNISVALRSGFPVGWIVGIHPADLVKLLFQELFLRLELIFEVFVVYSHILGIH